MGSNSSKTVATATTESSSSSSSSTTDTSSSSSQQHQRNPPDLQHKRDRTLQYFHYQPPPSSSTPDNNDDPSSTMLMQNAEYRNKCYTARDEYFKCTEIQPDCDRTMEAYVKLCPAEWRKFFDEQHKLNVFHKEHEKDFPGMHRMVEARYVTAGFGTGQKRHYGMGHLPSEKRGGFES